MQLPLKLCVAFSLSSCLVAFTLSIDQYRHGKLHSNQQNEATFRASKYTVPPPRLRSQENHTTCAPCFAEGHSDSDQSVCT